MKPSLLLTSWEKYCLLSGNNEFTVYDTRDRYLDKKTIEQYFGWCYYVPKNLILFNAYKACISKVKKIIWPNYYTYKLHLNSKRSQNSKLFHRIISFMTISRLIYYQNCSTELLEYTYSCCFMFSRSPALLCFQKGEEAILWCYLVQSHSGDQVLY